MQHELNVVESRTQTHDTRVTHVLFSSGSELCLEVMSGASLGITLQDTNPNQSDSQ